MCGVISKAVHILDILVPQGSEKEMSVTEISRELDMPVQSAHRILSSLSKHGFVAQNNKNKKYKLGLSVMKYGFLMWDSLMLRSVSKPFMEELSQKTNETVFFSHEGKRGRGVYRLYRLSPNSENIGTDRSKAAVVRWSFQPRHFGFSAPKRTR